MVHLFHADLNSGLPSDHVYSALRDRLGYLWLCTPKGVVRYNGYEFVHYGLSEGLANDDIWGLYLDRRNRLWLRSITSRLGYIENNRLKQLQAPAKNGLVYPRHITEYKDGILFITAQNDSWPPGKSSILCFEHGGRLKTMPFSAEDADVTDGNRVLSFGDDSLRTYSFGIITGPEQKSSCPGLGSGPYSSYNYHEGFNNYLLSYAPGAQQCLLTDLNTCTVQTLKLTDLNGNPERVLFADHGPDFLYILCTKTIYKIGRQGNVLDRYSISAVLGESAPRLTNFFEDSFWGQCLTTKEAGFYINYGRDRYFKAAAPELRGSAFRGTGADGSSFWSDSRDGSIRVDSNGVKLAGRDLPALTKTVPYKREQSLAISGGRLWLMDHRSGRLERIRMVPGKADISGQSDLRYWTLKDITREGDSSYIVATSGRGVNRIRLEHGKMRMEQIASGRFMHVCHDPFRKASWCYNNNQIKVIFSSGRSISINDGQLDYYGIRGLEQIIIDPVFGSVLLKDHKGIYTADITTGKVTRLFGRQVLEESQCMIKDSVLIVAGPFGMLFSRILGRNKLSVPVVYPNIKRSRYHYVRGLGPAGDDVLLQTDRGAIRIDLPAPASYRNPAFRKERYRLIADYGGRLCDLSQRPALSIEQEEKRILVDVINPEGVGKPRYRYRIAGIHHQWQESESGELFLPELGGGNHYKLQLQIRDALWISDVISIDLSVAPLWWQQTRWMVLLWLCSTVMFLAFVLAIVLLTRHYVVRSNKKKQFLTELELRSVYSQINPHFIFNTLNLSLFFIRRQRYEEAFNHINRFSKLLRGYLNSSRSRYITIPEEIANLRHYIELQQARFAQAFTYEILTQGLPEPEKISIPSLLLQPLIENAINHGLLPMERPGHLSVSFAYREEKKELYCVIDDDGIGRIAAGKLRQSAAEKRRSYGTDLTTELIELFNRYEKMGIRMEYIDKQPPLQGTTVIITINNPLYEKSYQKHHHR